MNAVGFAGLMAAVYDIYAPLLPSNAVAEKLVLSRSRPSSLSDPFVFTLGNLQARTQSDPTNGVQ
jgi:hypothetical protein